MFDVDTINRSITMSIGDTGAVAFRAVGYEFEEYVAPTVAMTVTMETRTSGEAEINVTKDDRKIVAHAPAGSTTGTITLTYAAESWTANPEQPFWADALEYYGLEVTGTPKDGDEIEIEYDVGVPGDRVLFTLKSQSGAVIMEKLCPLEDNRFVIYFHNSDTEALQPGTYIWDLRCIIHPYYDENGNVQDGDQIYTPYEAMTLTLMSTVGTI